MEKELTCSFYRNSKNGENGHGLGFDLDGTQRSVMETSPPVINYDKHAQNGQNKMGKMENIPEVIWTCLLNIG
jgi:hypothetical protein